jgi:hypothetical protein
MTNFVGEDAFKRGSFVIAGSTVSTATGGTFGAQILSRTFFEFRRNAAFYPLKTLIATAHHGKTNHCPIPRQQIRR